MSAFDDAASRLRDLAIRSGSFSFAPSDSLSQAISAARVPSCAGAYFITAVDANGSRVVYVGKSGTVHTDGSLGDQRMNARLKKKQQGQRREDFFRGFMEGGHIDALHFEWFETYRKGTGKPPFLAEAELLAAYLADTGRLPELNRDA